MLTNPCTQQWSEIERTDGMHYCELCEKNIVDLTTKTDAELIRFFQDKDTNVYGRLLASQLNRELVLPVSKIKWQLLMPLAFGSFVISPAHSNAQQPMVEYRDLSSGPNAVFRVKI